ALFVIAAVIAAGLVFWFARRYRNVHRRLDRVIRRIGADELRDIVIPGGLDGRIHVDRVVLTGRGALVVDFKNVAGTVFAGERLEEWAVLNAGARQPLRNPLGGLLDRVAAVQ